MSHPRIADRAVHAFVVALVLASSVHVGASGPVFASEPPLGGEVTLDDGTVLPPMPADQVVPTVQSQQLAEHADAAPAGLDLSPDQVGEGTVAAISEPEGALTGAAGALPNGLRREVLGFLPYWSLSAATRAALRYDLLSTVAYFSVGVSANGSLVRGTTTAPDPGWQGWNSAAMTDVINKAHAQGVRVVPTITLMSWSGDYTNLRTLLESSSNRARLVTEVVALVRSRSADGVNVDFEPVHSSLRAQFTQLVREIKAGLVKAGVGSYLTVDTMAGAAAWATGYDVVALTAPGAADALMVMAYDFSYEGSARAGGVAPIESDYLYASADAMRDHLELVSPKKLIWGVPYYGRAWNTQTNALNSPVRSPAQPVAFSYYFTDSSGVHGGKALAAKYGRAWDPVGQVPWFVFHDVNSNGWRQGYYDDPASLRIKYDHVLRHDLAGIGIWALGMDTGTPDLWNVIREKFVKVVVRVAGADRYATAAAVSAATFAPGVATAYVATGTVFPDALAGGPIAGASGAPVLLVRPDSLPPSTAAELERLRPAAIVVLGGPSAVNDSVFEQLKSFATTGSVARVAGPDRYATAAAASAAYFDPGAPVAYIATGTNFPDALAGGAAAGRSGGPILLATRTSLPPATVAELERLKPTRIVIVGGPSVVDNSVLESLRGHATGGTVTRLAGPDRYQTAVAISRATSTADADGTVYIAAGASFPDGLAGTPPAVLAGAPLLIVPAGGLPDAVAAELRRLDPGRVVILGGPSAVSDRVMAQIRALWD